MKRLAIVLLLLSACAPLLRRQGATRSDGVELVRKPIGAQLGEVRFIDSGLNRTYAEDEMILACGSRAEVVYEALEMSQLFGSLPMPLQVIRFRCVAPR